MASEDKLTSSSGTLRFCTPEKAAKSFSGPGQNVGDPGLTPEDILEFARLWQGEFGESLTLDEAHCKASRLMELYLALYRECLGSKPSFWRSS